ncbi:hypothetical protein Tco_0776610 [Tanacetum coccineum]
MELKTSSSFRTTGLLQPWQTLCKIFPNLLWEGLHYSLNHPTSLIPYPRFTKIIINHYMTSFPEISRRRYKDRVGMKIPDWMISEEMKYTEHYRMFAKVFGLDFPLTQLQPTESTQGTHRTPSAPRSIEKSKKLEKMWNWSTSTWRSMEIEKMVEGPENVIDNSSIHRNDDQNIPDTRLEPKSDKESPEVEITKDEEVKITNVVIFVNVNEEE